MKKIKWENHKIVFSVLTFCIGWACSLGTFHYIVDLDSLNEEVAAYSKTAYQEGCLSQGRDLQPGVNHFMNCHIKGEFYKADALFQLMNIEKQMNAIENKKTQ